MANDTPLLTRFEEGEVILINKGLNWTSYDVVRKVQNEICRRYKIKKLKIGHAGTLDPLASGLLILCTGRKTKQITGFQDLEKEYVATIKLGQSTPSYDLETEVDQEYPVEHITNEMIYDALKRFTGDLDQFPPRFSAKWVDGKRAYEFARKGKDPELKASRVNISELSLVMIKMPVLEIRVRCSKGTYIRSLAHDFGKALNSGAHLVALERTAIGSFRVAEALTVEDFIKKLNSE
jgi:tRNA pseudouridine55 synthase